MARFISAGTADDSDDDFQRHQRCVWGGFRVRAVFNVLRNERGQTRGLRGGHLLHDHFGLSTNKPDLYFGAVPTAETRPRAESAFANQWRRGIGWSPRTINAGLASSRY